MKVQGGCHCLKVYFAGFSVETYPKTGKRIYQLSWEFFVQSAVTVNVSSVPNSNVASLHSTVLSLT